MPVRAYHVSGERKTIPRYINEQKILSRVGNTGHNYQSRNKNEINKGRKDTEVFLLHCAASLNSSRRSHKSLGLRSLNPRNA
jgi:hypothetical protein